MTHPQLQALQHVIQENSSILVEELWDAPKALILAMAQRITGKHLLVITGSAQEENNLFHDLPFFTDRPILDFPAWDVLPSEEIPPSPDVVGERHALLGKLLQEKEPSILIATLQSVLQRVVPPQKFADLHLKLKVGDTLGFEALIERLKAMEYTQVPVAGDKGEFAVRGGIIDLFPVTSTDPIRIEFWGDRIESLRTYDPVGQKSIEKVQNLSVTLAKERELLQAHATLFDYLGSDTIVVLDDLLAIEDRWTQLKTLLENARDYITFEALLDLMTPLQKMLFASQPFEELGEARLLDKQEKSFYSTQAPLYRFAFSIFQREITARRWQNPFYSLASFLNATEGEEILKKVSGLPREVSLTFIVPTESDKSFLTKKIIDLGVALPPNTVFSMGYLSDGFAITDPLQLYFPLSEITHQTKIRRQKLRSTTHSTPYEGYDLAPGESVVHLNCGIGKFLGIEKRPNNVGIESEFFLLEYANDAKLYVPLHQANLLSKYIGSSEETPKLHELGSKRWLRTREKTEEAIVGYANDLLKLYAERSVYGGFAYPADGPEIGHFEDSFPYVETDDQLQAINQVKADMSSTRAMDRLVCGDVGYGKTEVALRAAFKAVADGGKQVAILVPTTVLALQHYETFVERMRNYPIKIALLSRFRSAKETQNAIKGIREGTIDIAIGTHRLLSADVTFKDLGLIIIDEEQRFGVKAKEALKKVKVGVDCLTLSATPIPRTLYLSLIGARDLSTINTPPQDRLPIKTILAEPTETLLRNALLRELSREGQAYVIHNRIETIYDIADQIKKLLPQVRILVAHGQMHTEEIDSVFHAFKTGRVDILVATTIVENGIDIPNANTILIHNADHFGLADLYQLRGRVGRWNRRAYAYFLVRKPHLLPELTRKRMQALAEASGYGGGMKLAMRDLEIRGAGDILGTEQSGQVAAIGFYLYCKLLKRTIKTLQGQLPSALVETHVEIPVDARIPESYISEPPLRMEIYQRLGDALSLEEIEAIWEELKDRFGKPPEPLLWLYHLSRIKVEASLQGFTHLKWEGTTLRLQKGHGKKATLKRYPVGPITTPRGMEERIRPLIQP